MRRHALALSLLCLLAPVRGAAADQPRDGKGAYELGCALARAVDAEVVCRELLLFKHDGEQRMGEELAQLLDAGQLTRAVRTVDAELQEKKRAPGAGKDCPPARPLCAFSEGALTALRGGLGPEPKK